MLLRNAGDSQTVNAEISIFMFVWILRTFDSKWRLLRKNRGRERVREGGAMLTHSELVLTLGLLPLCHVWRKPIKKCDRESADRQTDRQTDREIDTRSDRD